MPASFEPVRENLDVTLPPRPFLAPYAPTIAKAYHPVSPLSPAFNVGLTGAGVGLFVSAIKNSLESHNKGAMGVFSRTGWIIGYFGKSLPSLSPAVSAGETSRDTLEKLHITRDS